MFEDATLSISQIDEKWRTKAVPLQLVKVASVGVYAGMFAWTLLQRERVDHCRNEATR
jgi:hypothetical protein